MTESLKLPVGIEDFAEIRQAGFYYIDKTNSLNSCWTAGARLICLQDRGASARR